MEKTGARAILDILIHEGTKVIFGYPGGSILPVYGTMSDVKKQLHHVLTRNEQAAGFAASGYARASGKTGVCIASSGPGATNLITSIADAMADSIPLLCLVGQVPSAYLGTDHFQEVDIIQMTKAITKWNYQITKASELPNALAYAFYILHNKRPGPVLLSITKDAQIESFSYEYKKYAPRPAFDINLFFQFYRIKKASALINNAKRPYLLLGHGVLISQAESEVMELATKAGIPVACTLLGLSAFPEDHPLFVGVLGMYGNYASNLLTNQADVIIAIGMRFDNRVTGNSKKYATQAKIIHIDIDQHEMNRKKYACVSLLGSAKKTLKKLIPYINKNNHSEWISQFLNLYKIEYDKVIANERYSTPKDIKMAKAVFLLSQKTRGKCIIVTDVGYHQMVVFRHFEFNQPNSHLTSGGLGSMGFAIPAAIGAQFAHWNKSIVAIIGDGGFQMCMTELGTIAQGNLPIKILLLNNSHLGLVKQAQIAMAQKDFSFVKLKNPAFTKIAESYGIASKKIIKNEELESGIAALLESSSSFLLEVVCEEEENVFPIIPDGGSVEDVLLEEKR